MNAVNELAIVDALRNGFGAIIPEAVLLAAACLLFLWGTFRPSRRLSGATALAALAVAGVGLWLSHPSAVGIPDPQTPLTEASRQDAVEAARRGAETALFTSPVLLDRFAVLIKVIALVGGAVLVLLSWNEVSTRQASDYHGCLLVIVAGTSLTGSANELITLFLAMELVSIPTYVLLYLLRTDTAAQEAAVKYFMLSIFSSALMLFGFSYLYGLAGTTNLPALVDTLYRAEFSATVQPGESGLPPLAQVALVMVVAGLGFKITAVPFHFYAPDVYQGTPTPGAAMLAFVPKVVGFVSLFLVLGFVQHEVVIPARTFEAGLEPFSAELVTLDRGRPPGLALGSQVPILLWILAAVTMLVGNMLGLLQDRVKRMLAYSSVGHAGYMLIGLAVAPDLHEAVRKGGEPIGGGVEAVLFYLVAYGAMTIGVFGVLAYLSTPERPIETVDDLAGLGISHPGVAILMALFLFSLIGLPLTAGFAGKMMLFWGAMAIPITPGAADHGWLFRGLALIGAISAAIGAYYYLRIVAAMYLRNPIRPVVKPWAWPGLATLLVCAAFTLGLGVYPEALAGVIRGVLHPTGEQPAAAVSDGTLVPERGRVAEGETGR